LTDFQKILSYHFLWKSTRGSRVDPCGRTDRWTGRHDKVSSHFSQFCECA